MTRKRRLEPPPERRNCKPGDWAIVVSNSRAHGRIVKCIKWVGQVDAFGHADYWLTDIMNQKRTGERYPYYGDTNLRPLQGKPEEILPRVIAQRLTMK